MLDTAAQTQPSFLSFCLSLGCVRHPVLCVACRVCLGRRGRPLPPFPLCPPPPQQITYLQVGASSVAGAWSSSPLKSDAVRVGALFRSEVDRILQAAAAGQFTQRDLAAAPQLLADVAGQQAAGPLQVDRIPPAAALQEGCGGGGEGDGSQMMDESAGGGGEGDGNARVFMDWLLRQPLGEVLLSYAAVPNSSWAPGETEYGT